MKLPLYILLYCMFTVMVNANNIISYEYWFNMNYNNRTTVHLSNPVKSLTVDAEIDVSGLNAGINTLFIRYLDSNNKWTPVISRRLIIPFSSKNGVDIASNKLDEYEYWFDNNYEKRITSVCNSSEFYNFNQIIDVSLLKSGIHNFQFRIKDKTSEWSPVINKRFIIPVTTPNKIEISKNKLVEYEYWFDNNYKNRIRQSLEPNIFVKIDEDIELPELLIGDHNLYIRFKDSIGNFSIVRANLLTIIGDTNTIYLNSGWNLISSYILPQKPDSINNILKEISDNLVIAKNNLGAVYIPSFSINTIGNWNYTQGYQLYMGNKDSLMVIGKITLPAESPVQVKSGWNMIAYLRNSEMNAILALASITDNGNLIIAKNLAGQVYIPGFGINSIGNLVPGQGYRVYVTNEDSLIYPDN